MKVSLVVSVYNEEEGLENFFKVLCQYTQELDHQFEYLFVNDGSLDKSYDVLLSLKEKNPSLDIKIISFPRNFGHEAAMICGIDNAFGDCCICLDSDLQHPPKAIEAMIGAYEEGHDVVLMARRTRMDRGAFYNFPSKMFYYLINKISDVNFIPQASDFFLISSDMAKTLRENYRERTRFIRGIIQFLGRNKKVIKYDASARLAGESKYNFLKLILLSFSAIASFSHVPLKLGLLIGGISGLFSAFVLVYSIIQWLNGGIPPGYTTIVVLNSFLFSILFILVGIIGEYVGFIFDETKSRPLYIVDSVTK